jgi:uncharacterized membrane-anchored protein YhcB (DUF1043 family)
MKKESKKQLVVIALIMVIGIGAAIGALMMRDENSKNVAAQKTVEEAKIDVPKEIDVQISEIDNVIKSISDAENEIPSVTLEELE